MTVESIRNTLLRLENIEGLPNPEDVEAATEAKQQARSVRKWLRDHAGVIKTIPLLQHLDFVATFHAFYTVEFDFHVPAVENLYNSVNFTCLARPKSTASIFDNSNEIEYHSLEYMSRPWSGKIFVVAPKMAVDDASWRDRVSADLSLRIGSPPLSKRPYDYQASTHGIVRFYSEAFDQYVAEQLKVFAPLILMLANYGSVERDNLQPIINADLKRILGHTA